MHDIRFIREHPEAFDAGLAKRGVEARSGEIGKLDEANRKAVTAQQENQAEQNKTSKEIGKAKGQKDEREAERLMKYMQVLKTEAQEAALANDDLNDLLATLPNLPADDVPEGADEAGNVEIKRWPLNPPHPGHPRESGDPASDVAMGSRFRGNDDGGEGDATNFTPREHFDIGAPLGLDFESAQAVSGARFAYLKGPVARLNRAIGQFMLDTHTTKFGYTEVNPPVLVRDEAMFGTTQLPKFAEDSFQTNISLDAFDYIEFKLEELNRINLKRRNDDPDASVLKLEDREVWDSLPNPPNRRWLIPTAEVSLTNLVREKILSEAELPLRFTALTPCFRSEAGAAGRDTRGLIRQHQFEKVELVSITTPDQSDEEHERMTEAAEHILEALGLPYRRMLLCAGDMGFAARKTYDLEVWLPGQGTYREISSCSNCGDFQARRMKARYRPEGQQKGTELVHTLNGSGLAVGRTLVAVLENYQNADGSVAVPPALAPYMAGATLLEPAR